MLKSELKLSIFNQGTLIAFVIIMFMFIKSMLDGGVFQLNNLGDKFDYLYIITIPMALSGFLPFACIFPVMPYGTSFCDDYNSGYIKFITIRTGYKKYCFTRIATVGLSGGIAIFLPFLIIFIVAIIVGKPCTGIQEDQFYLYTMWENYVSAGGGSLVLAAKLLLAFLFGAVWSLVGLAVSAWIPNRYVTLIAPFIIYQSLWLLLDKVPYNPVDLLRGDASNITFWGIILVQLCWIAFSSIIFFVGFNRRMLHE